MPLAIEDYALIGDTQSVALVGRDGSIDWLCLPRFDSGACFAALLGAPEHGRWLLAPSEPVLSSRRRYRPGTLVLETEMTTRSGVVRIVDCMPMRGTAADVVRIVEGASGEVPMQMELVMRFDYGSIVPWVRRVEGVLHAIAGPDALSLRCNVPIHGRGLTTVSEFVARPGEMQTFNLTWSPSNRGVPRQLDVLEAVSETERWWRKWANRCTYQDAYRDDVLRSLVTLKALTYQPTGGIVAAPTMSLPEQIGGVRNWDYRYCWLRDATFTLYAFLLAGYTAEASAWTEWLLRAVAGDPAKLQILYGPAGERRIDERELDWLPGYEGSRPVRLGNAARTQRQLDVYGEVLDAMHQARRAGLDASPAAWDLQRALVDFLEQAWCEPDEGIWEVRGPRRHFTHSKVMAWVAVDRAIKGIERFGLPGPLERWKKVRADIHSEVCARGVDERGAFTQYYGGRELDASLLMIPLVGFLPAHDPRVAATVTAIERELCVDGLVRRYETSPQHSHVDGLPGREGVFLACSFWLADNYALLGRDDDAHRVFERLLSLRNDVGLLSEEYDPWQKRLVGNFPQAFSHVGLINTAFNLSRMQGPANERPR